MTEKKEESEILLRSKEIPDLPFKGKLEYRGVQAIVSSISKYDSPKLKTSIEEDIRKEYDLERYRNKSRRYKDISPKSLIYEEKVATSFSDLIKINSETPKEKYNLYKIDNEEYVVKLTFKRVFEIIPRKSTISITARSYKTFSSIPDIPDKTNFNGKFMESGIKPHGDRLQILFKELHGIKDIFFKSYDTKMLEVKDVNKMYDVHELRQYTRLGVQDKTESVGEYCKATTSVKNGDYIIKCDSSEGPVTFRFSLTKLNKLPEWIEERIDINDLMTNVDSETSLFVEIKDADNDSDSKWVSELGDKELVEIK